MVGVLGVVGAAGDGADREEVAEIGFQGDGVKAARWLLSKRGVKMGSCFEGVDDMMEGRRSLALAPDVVLLSQSTS